LEAQWSHYQSALSAWCSLLLGAPENRPHTATQSFTQDFGYSPGYKISRDLRFSWWWKLIVVYRVRPLCRIVDDYQCSTFTL
jgi:hypothetical protein